MKAFLISRNASYTKATHQTFFCGIDPATLTPIFKLRKQFTTAVRPVVYKSKKTAHAHCEKLRAITQALQGVDAKIASHPLSVFEIFIPVKKA